MKHLQHFGLAQDPFQNEPDLRFYFDGAAQRDAQLRVERALRQHKGLSVLTGEGGTGKSLLARRLLERLEEELFEAALMVMMPGSAGAESLVPRLARQLGIEDPPADRSALLRQVYDQLAMAREEGRHAVLIVDDAHVLGAEAMASLAGLLNLEYEDRRLLSLLLVGLPELNRALSTDLTLAQRVEVRVHLEGLRDDDARAYLDDRLRTAGGRPEILADDAVRLIAERGRGRPRLMNTIADNALFEAFLAGRPRVEGSDVERAAADLGVGADPGSTYVHLRHAQGASPAAGAPESAAPSAAPGDEEPGLQGGDPTALLDAEEDLESELASVLESDDEGSSGALDLEAALDAQQVDDGAGAGERRPRPAPREDLAEPTRVALPDEEDALAEPTRLQFADEQTTPVPLRAPEPQGPPKEDDELDDLFVELIDD